MTLHLLFQLIITLTITSSDPRGTRCHFPALLPYNPAWNYTYDLPALALGLRHLPVIMMMIMMIMMMIMMITITPGKRFFYLFTICLT
jgi:hypothetical protein